MSKLLRNSILLFLCITAVACMKTLSINMEQETTAILTLLKEADSFYKQDQFIIHRAMFPQPEWVVAWLGIPTPGNQFEPTENNIKELTKRKLMHGINGGSLFPMIIQHPIPLSIRKSELVLGKDNMLFSSSGSKKRKIPGR